LTNASHHDLFQQPLPGRQDTASELPSTSLPRPDQLWRREGLFSDHNSDAERGAAAPVVREHLPSSARRPPARRATPARMRSRTR
jgi:hypothetical protein